METEKDIGAEIIEKLEELNSNLDEIILRAKNKEESKTLSKPGQMLKTLLVGKRDDNKWYKNIDSF